MLVSQKKISTIAGIVAITEGIITITGSSDTYGVVEVINFNSNKLIRDSRNVGGESKIHVNCTHIISLSLTIILYYLNYNQTI